MIQLYRLYRWLYLHKVPFIPRLLQVVNRLVFSLVLPALAQLGSNVLLGYHGLGIVIHARSKIGNNVNIGPGVVIGGLAGNIPVPVIEDDVQIGAGAKILGPVIIGRGAQIGANAVVIRDVPAGAVCVGIPGRIV